GRDEPHAADRARRAFHRRAVGRVVPEDAHLPAALARCEPAARGPGGRDLARRGAAGPRDLGRAAARSRAPPAALSATGTPGRRVSPDTSSRAISRRGHTPGGSEEEGASR